MFLKRSTKNEKPLDTNIEPTFIETEIHSERASNIVLKNEIDSEIDNHFTWLNIVCFGFAGLPYHLMFSAVSIYGNKFLLDEISIEPRYTAIVLFVSRAIDALTDPLYGYLINISPVTRFGKLKPW